MLGNNVFILFILEILVFNNKNLHLIAQYVHNQWFYMTIKGDSKKN